MLKPLELLLLLAALLPISLASQNDKHETGRCIMRGQCGKESFFSPELPCPDNNLATKPDLELREALVGICGEQYATGSVCCDQAQVTALRENLKKAENLIASCPACKNNFFDFFCGFTCSPDQSSFLKIESTKEMPGGSRAVTHLSYFVSQRFSRGFFESCKDVKFSATNGYVMDLIGGGATDGQGFLEFLGQKSIVGSPIQIDFPVDTDAELAEWDPPFRHCNSSDIQSKCACVDCPSVCQSLPELNPPGKTCNIGVMPCLSFSVLFLYVTSLSAFFAGYAFYLRSRKSFGNTRGLQLHNEQYLSSDELDDHSTLSDRHLNTYALNNWLEGIFYRIGMTCASFPYASIGLSVVIVLFLSIGWTRFAIETNPIKLWVSPTADVALQKNYFDSTFGPFYRAEQMFLSNASHPTSSVLTFESLKFWFDLEDQLKRMRDQHGTGIEDLCLQPTGQGCVIQSLTGYWQGDFENVSPSNWAKELQRCADQPVQCLPVFQQPLKPQMILGGYTGDDWLSSSALVSTIVLKNSLEPALRSRASAWERDLQQVLYRAQEIANTMGLRLSFSTDVSLEEELNKSANTDARIVIISYLAMFLYVSLALGTSRWQGKATLVQTKFSLGLSGIAIVLLSISASVGLFSLLGVKITLIIAEVIPFLVLAIGVDNIFLLCHEFANINASEPSLSIPIRVALASSRVGPSILLSATSETLAFAIGAAVAMPAVRNFAIYAAGAVFFDALLQMTMFTAALALDQARVESGRFDCVPCVQTSVDGSALDVEQGYVFRFIQRRLTPGLMQPVAKRFVLFLFFSWAALSIALLPSIEFGLDQKIALPKDSYLVDYFRDLESYFGVGPPVYFVAKSPNITERAAQQAVCGRFTTCDDFSMANVLEQERKRPDVSFLLEPAASWLDDFFYWLNPQLEMCCRVRIDDPSRFCGAEEGPSRCRPCMEDRSPAWNITLSGMPEGEEFMKYVRAWLSATSTEDCPLAGKAPYGDALALRDDGYGLDAFHTRTFHTPLRTQVDLINSLAAGQRVAKEMSRLTGLDVFAYAVHYIYFAQYSNIVSLTFNLLGTALLAIFLIATLVLGSLTAAAILCATVALIVLNVAGAMVLFGISLNALSVVNLVVCVGIGVEFTSHMIRAYMLPTTHFATRVLQQEEGYQELRSRNALAQVGPSVFTGITMCKFCGVVVLAFTQSKIFEIYYFRMWLALVFVAASHGLILLPVVLSMFGPRGYVCKEIASDHAELPAASDPLWQ
ncbi:patched sphingolipid transporter [Protomyces lactucae-debilis]|uniref:Patched sphingolipid transporter n=1 Tax=Protomyces lactucae-debilis TaxID=2754530 RepID=A0A1Y2FT38_PROLT|nr:patched sphingolipid transporter [Protomyces lactucae-debilis]ORY87162.1 patched sphingolipid transporter [Protomyces lactucae-debilis]